MGQHDYAVTDIGTYGVREQPAVAVRMRPHLVATRVGLVSAVVGLAAALAVAFALPRFSDGALVWPWVLVAAAVVMLLVCAFQAWVWHQAMQEWSGRRDVNLSPFVRPSWFAHLLSYAAVLAALAAVVWVVADSRLAYAAPWLALVVGAALVAAQLLAGVEYFRLEGPPGTLPAHFRRLLRSQNPQ